MGEPPPAPEWGLGLTFYFSLFTYHFLLTGHVAFAVFFVEVFEGVAEGGAGHGFVMLVEEGLEVGAAGTLADFAEHPADGFVNEVVFVIEQDLGDGEGVEGFGLLDVVEGGDHGDAAFPEDGGAGEFGEEGFVAAGEVVADEMLGTDVDQVPVVDAMGVFQIKVVEFFLVGLIGGVIAGDEDEEGGEAEFVFGAVEEVFDFLKGEVGEFFGELALLGEGEAQEEVAFAVLAGAGFEEACGLRGFFG